MGSEAWLISVMMRFTSNGSRVMREISAATAIANKAVDEHTARVNRATAAMERFRASTVGIGTSIAGAFSLASASVGAFAVVQAAKLQRTLTAIRNETGADPRKIAGVYNSVFDIANRIGVSPTTAAQSWLDVSRLTAGQLSIAQMKKVAPRVLDFASMLNFNRPDVSVDDATKAGLQLVHMFRAYTPSKMLPLLDQVYRLSGLMAETPAQAVRQMSYYEPLFKGLKIDDKTSVAMMALLDRGGFRMKVGTNVRAAMLEALGPLQLTKHAQLGQLGMLEDMGVFNRSGRFAWNRPDGGTDFIGMMLAVSRWAQGKAAQGVPQSELAKILYGTFGKQGGNIMQFMADPQMLGILHDIVKYQKNPNVSLAAGIRNRDDTLGYQSGRAWGNLQAVLVELGYTELPELTSKFRVLADDLHRVQTYLHQHREVERLIADTFAWVTAMSALRFAMGGLRVLGGIGTLFKGLEGVSGVTKALMFFDNIAFAGIGGKVIGLGKAIVGLESPAVAATSSVGGVAGVLNTLANAGGSFLASPLARFLRGGLGSVFTGAIISAAQQQDAQRTYNNMARRYGAGYANWLLRHSNGVWPYDAVPGQIPENALDPATYKALHAQGSVPGITITVNDRTSQGVNTQVRTTGAIPSGNAQVPKPLFLRGPNLGLSPY